MMMDINATLIVQCLNFAIAYFLLTTFLFKPALRMVDHEEQHRKDLMDAIEASDKRVEEQQAELRKLVQTYQNEFVQEIPQVEQESLFVFKGIAPQISFPELSMHDTKRLTDEVVPSLLAKVEHVRH